MSTNIIVFAHRGASGYEFENTISAFDKALEMGSNGLETDCWLLKDGYVAVHHDKFVKTQNNYPKNIAKLTKEKISTIQLPNGDSIPLIQELFSRYEKSKDPKGFSIQFSIDLQDLKVGIVLATIIEEYSMEDRVYLCSENLLAFRRIRKTHPNIKLVASNIRKLVQKPEFPYILGLHSLKLQAINLQGKNMTQKVSDTIHQYRYKMFIWDLHSAESVRMGMQFHPDAIYADYPDIALKLIHDSNKSNRIINNNN